jgi:hypothetical protein
MQQIIINKIAQFAIIATLISVSYIVGLSRGENKCILSTHQASIDQQKKYNATLDEVLRYQESNLQKINSFTAEINHEREINKKLINANNKLNRQFQLLLDASAANMHTSTSYAVHAGESSTVAPDRILSTIQYNYYQCNRWREQLIMWQKWYNFNR